MANIKLGKAARQGGITPKMIKYMGGTAKEKILGLWNEINDRKRGT